MSYKTVSCPKCGEPDLAWFQTKNGKWWLKRYLGEGQYAQEFHDCEKTKQAKQSKAQLKKKLAYYDSLSYDNALRSNPNYPQKFGAVWYNDLYHTCVDCLYDLDNVTTIKERMCGVHYCPNCKKTPIVIYSGKRPKGQHEEILKKLENV